MPAAGQGQQWSDVLCCISCGEIFTQRRAPVNLICGHVTCRTCLLALPNGSCPLDETESLGPVEEYPLNAALLYICSNGQYVESLPKWTGQEPATKSFLITIENALLKLAAYLNKAESERGGTVFSEVLSRTVQRKLVSLLCFQLAEDEGRSRALKTCRAIADRVVTEVLLGQQVPSHLSTQLWTAVRARGCQFLGPAMQEDVLKLILIALGSGAAIARKTLVMYVVQMLANDYPQVSKTCVGHVVQLLYRASCFHVIKREGESSLMQLKEEFRDYDPLRKEHDSQIVQMALEVGLRICPDQWSALLYGDQQHRSHMQSIIDKMQSPQSYQQGLEELTALAEKGDDIVATMIPLLSVFATIHPTYHERVAWSKFAESMTALSRLMELHVLHSGHRQEKRAKEMNGSGWRGTANEKPVIFKYKTRMCRDVMNGHVCPRGQRCTWAHSDREVEDARRRGGNAPSNVPPPVQIAPPLPMPQQHYPPPTMPPPPAPSNGMPPGGDVVHMMPVVLSPQHHPMPVQHVVMVPPNAPPPPVASVWTPAPGQPQMMMPHASPPVHSGTTFWIQNPPIFAMDGVGFDGSWSNDIGPREIDADQLHLKRKEILSRLAPLTTFEDDDVEVDGGIGHVSYTVASSVLDDRGDIHPLVVVGGPPPLELPPIPVSYAPVLNTNAEDAVAILNDIAAFQQPRPRAPSIPLVQVTTVLTMCPGGMMAADSSHTATVQSDCTTMHVTDTLCQPLPTPLIQRAQVMIPVPQMAMMPQAQMDPVVMAPVAPVGVPVAVPAVLPTLIAKDPQNLVSFSLDRIIDVKERLNEAEGTPMSCAVSQQLRVELEIAEREMDSLDPRTQASCLLRELEQVDRQIEIIESSRTVEMC